MLWEQICCPQPRVPRRRPPFAQDGVAPKDPLFVFERDRLLVPIVAFQLMAAMNRPSPLSGRQPGNCGSSVHSVLVCR
jgi:hypothetical protein